MSAEDVNELVIDPMVARLPPPKHIRGDDKAAEGLLNRYRGALAGFRRPILEEGWETAASRLTVWTWPTPGEVAEACMEAQRKAEREGRNDEWVQAAEDASYAYTKRFMKTSAVAARARAEGREAELKRYVKECAWVQAQAIEGQQRLGYNGTVLFPARQRAEEAQEEWFRQAA
jgi:hypothetical protein